MAWKEFKEYKETGKSKQAKILTDVYDLLPLDKEAYNTFRKHKTVVVLFGVIYGFGIGFLLGLLW